MRDNYVNVGRRRQMHRHTVRRVLVVVISAVVIFALSLLLGTYLRRQVENMPPRGDIPEEMLSGQLPADTSDAGSRSIIAAPLALDALFDASAVNAAVEALVLGSREAVSLCLRDDAGNIWFRSQVAQNLTGQTASGVDLSLLLSALDAADIYASAVFGVTLFGEQDPVRRDLLRAYELSLAAEIGASGVEEILLTGLPLTVDTLDDVTAFLTELDALLPGTVQLAVAVPADVTRAAGGTVLIKQLSLACDTVALDLRALHDTDADALYAAACGIFADASLYFSKYNMRVLISPADDAAFSTFRQALEVNGIQNWQVVQTPAGPAPDDPASA